MVLLADEERLASPCMRMARNLAIRLTKSAISREVNEENAREFERGFLKVQEGKSPLRKRKRARPSMYRDPFETPATLKAALAKNQKLTEIHAENVMEYLRVEQRNPLELDFRPVTLHLNDHALWSVGERFPRVRKVNLSGWHGLSIAGLRSLALGFGENLLEINLSKTDVNDEMVGMLTACFCKLTTLTLRECKEITNSSMRAIANSIGRRLRVLDVADCSKLTEDGLMWLSGTIGPSSIPCSALETLCVENCVKIKEKGVANLGSGCRRLRFVNFSGCELLSDEAFVPLARECKQLEIIHIGGCILVTNKSLKAFGENCPKLRSVNLSRVVNVNDEGIKFLCERSEYLQTLNVAGLKEVSELGIYFVLRNNPALQVLNCTGCELISQEGLRQMLRGLEFVELAKTFTGIKPISEMAKRKLLAQRRMVEDNASRVITGAFRGHTTRVRLWKENYERLRHLSAQNIQRWLRGVFARGSYLVILLHRAQEKAAIKIQVFFRSIIARSMRAMRQAKRDWELKNEKYAVKLQAAFRGKVCRGLYPEVPIVIQQLHDERQEELKSVLSVRIQACIRRYLSVSREQARKEELHQRARDMQIACVKIQGIFRMSLAKLEKERLRKAFLAKHAREVASAVLLQKVFRTFLARKEFVWKLLNFEEAKKKAVDSVTMLQCIYRGYKARLDFEERMLEHAARIRAAVQIQKLARKRLAANWEELKALQIREYVTWRSAQDYQRAMDAVNRRHELKRLGHERDSASEDEEIQNTVHAGEDENDDWQQHWDEHSQRHFYFSPSRNVRSFEKFANDEFEQYLNGCFVRIFDESVRVWREALITKYNRKKRKHRCEFYEIHESSNFPDHEWIRCAADESRIQIYDTLSETWSMLRHMRLAFLRDQRQIEAANTFDFVMVDETSATERWEALVDDETGRTYFHDTWTGTTQWEPPSEVPEH